MNDHRVVRRPALGGVKARDRRGTGSVRTQAVNRFCRKGDEAAGAQDLRRTADLGHHAQA